MRASRHRWLSTRRAAPPRTPVQWKHSQFYDEAAFEKEFRRVLDCFNLCDAFPALFRVVDESATGELHSVPTAQLSVVNDGCTLCDLCFTSKCPYVPPHPLNIDFPHMILRYRALEHSQANQALAAADSGGMETGPWIDDSHDSDPPPAVDEGLDRTLAKKPPSLVRAAMAQQDVAGPAGSALAPLVNAVTQRPPGSAVRKLMQSTLGLDAAAALPRYSSETFMHWFGKRVPSVSQPQQADAPKVVLYVTCFVNHNRPEIGKAIVALLEASGVHVEACFPGCCGMPQLEQGRVGEVSKRAAAICSDLMTFVQRGFDVVSLTPSCTLMLKQEWPLLLRERSDMAELAARTREASEYLVTLAKAGALVGGKTPDPLDATVTLHNACHARAQNMGFKAKELLSYIPQLKVSAVERCSGHGGTWGFEHGHYQTALRVGAPAIKTALDDSARSADHGRQHYVISECPLAADHLMDGMQTQQPGAAAASTRCHPAELLARAYRLLQ